MTGASRWTLDLGNSALKVVDWSAPEPRALRLAWEEAWEDGLARLAGAPPDLALVSSVVDGPRREAVLGLLGALGVEARVNPEVPLAVACRSPETVGRDRLHAAAGAWRLGGEAAVVVDAGTAVTVDALAAPAGAPTFLGGAIAPGPQLLAGALRAGGAQLAAFEVLPRADAPALGRDSREALEAGGVVGLHGAVRELVRRVAAEAGLGGAPVWLTGGAADLLPDGLFEGRALRREPLLVHHGLLAAEGTGG